MYLRLSPARVEYSYSLIGLRLPPTLLDLEFRAYVYMRAPMYAYMNSEFRIQNFEPALLYVLVRMYVIQYFE
jgi:hypothetical protein